MKLDTFDRHVLEQKGKAQDIVKKLYGVSISETGARKGMAMVRRHLRFKSELDKEPNDLDDLEELTMKADGSQVSTRMILLSAEEKKDPLRIMELHGYDPLKWEIIETKTRRNHWNAYSKVDGKVTLHAFESTIRVKPIQEKISSQIVTRVIENLKVPRLEKYRYTKGGMMMELPFCDLHLGNWSLDLSVKLFKETVLDILACVKEWGLDIELIEFPVGQDFFHVDTPQHTTTKGTQLDVSAPWTEIYAAGVEVLIWAVEQLRAIAPVNVRWVPGNHDHATSYYAVVSLHHVYQKVKSVQVDFSSDYGGRKYIVYGINMIGLGHGEKEKRRIEDLMQVEQPEAWGETVYREWHLGHEHHEEAKEVGGVIIRKMSSSTSFEDRYHKDHGFVGATRKAQAIIWDKERGKRLTIDSNIRITERESD